MEAYFIGTWFASIICGVMIASQKDYPVGGFILCLLFGPVGMFACAFIDGRPKCPQCKTALSDGPPQCPSCWARFRWNKSKTVAEFVAYEFRREAPAPKKHSEPE
jgi:hypothetical protein